jgi:hypothetical protein
MARHAAASLRVVGALVDERRGGIVVENAVRSRKNRFTRNGPGHDRAILYDGVAERGAGAEGVAAPGEIVLIVIDRTSTSPLWDHLFFSRTCQAP